MSVVKLDPNFCKFLSTMPSDQWQPDCCDVLWKALETLPSQCPVPTYYERTPQDIDVGDVNVTGGGAQII